MEEQQQRHEKYNDIEYNLELNLKNAPGGLRIYRQLHWVAKRCFTVNTLQQLDGKGCLPMRNMPFSVMGKNSYGVFATGYI